MVFAHTNGTLLAKHVLDKVTSTVWFSYVEVNKLKQKYPLLEWNMLFDCLAPRHESIVLLLSLPGADG